MARRSFRPPSGYGSVILLAVGTYVLALVATSQWMASVLLLAQTGTVWQVLRISMARPAVRRAAAVLFGLALVAAVLNLRTEGTPVGGTVFLLSSLLYLIAPYSMVRHLGHRSAVDRETMLGALAAYLLLGMAFAFAYRCLGLLLPGPFFGDAGDGTLPDCLFFSFVTLTTTGYGDLTPAGNPGQSVAVLEALAGQLFLVTAVAKVVDAWHPRGWRRSSSE